MIRPCTAQEQDAILKIINDAAQVYRGVIPADRWTEPYMSEADLLHEIAAGVLFWGFEVDGQLTGVMGIQHVQDVTLIRHAYVRPASQGQGIGALLLAHLRSLAQGQILIGTWADATWAIHFYQRLGFVTVDVAEKEFLLRRYWTVPERQIETSVVLRSL